ncbi:MAG: hypothetical protein KC543_06075 [Myxococcales bacterium]|nr:hypothetical protein [Myxococcales bacterium]
MPTKQKHQPKSGTKRKRRKQSHGPGQGSGQDAIHAHGAMSGMVSGFKRAVGAPHPTKKRNWVDAVWILVLLGFVVALIVWRVMQ